MFISPSTAPLSGKTFQKHRPVKVTPYATPSLCVPLPPPTRRDGQPPKELILSVVIVWMDATMRLGLPPVQGMADCCAKPQASDYTTHSGLNTTNVTLPSCCWNDRTNVARFVVYVIRARGDHRGCALARKTWTKHLLVGLSC